ncbi:MAG: hypothetical protein WAQ08_09075 [Aquabacterium sp.]|uniref:hypothetical protein n=1 Tax=Aquabacterium sp. TaxID=1872578 RepID=UPI003BAE1663
MKRLILAVAKHRELVSVGASAYHTQAEMLAAVEFIASGFQSKEAVHARLAGECMLRFVDHDHDALLHLIGEGGQRLSQRIVLADANAVERKNQCHPAFRR